jgi:hypothetical protein
MKTLQTISFTAFFCLTLIVLGGTIFAVLVEYPNWFANVPTSLEATRNFYKVFHPGYFFQTVAPLAFVAGIIFVVLGWKMSATRNLVLMSLVVIVAAELLTFFYIYPRLNILFGPEAASQSIDALRTASQQFTTADQIRTCMSVLANMIAVAAMFKFFKARYAIG